MINLSWAKSRVYIAIEVARYLGAMSRHRPAIVDRPAWLWDAEPGVLPQRPGVWLHPRLSAVHGGHGRSVRGQSDRRRERHVSSAAVGNKDC